MVEASKPDIILEEMVERSAMSQIPVNPPEVSHPAQIAAIAQRGPAPALP
jgi:hypothetical protein